MDKLEFSQKILIWLKNKIQKELSGSYKLLDIFIPESSLSKLPNKTIKSLPGYSSWDFKPDIIAILKNKNTDKIEFIIVNRSISAISLKEIGELYCYSKILKPTASFLFSLNGVSSEVNILLLEEKIKNNLLKFKDKKIITILTWNKKRNDIILDSIIPFEKRKNIF